MKSLLPEWADFLPSEVCQLESMSIKKLRSLAKRAHLSAGGGKSELVKKLLEFVGLKQPPEWFTELKSKQNALLDVDENSKHIRMKVGQYLRVPCVSRKMYGNDVQVEERKPSDCIQTSVGNARNPPVGKVSYGNHVVKISALSEGTACLVHYQRPGPVSDWVASKRIRITINQ